MKTPSIDVVRALADVVELRATDDGIGLLTGYFSKFGDWYEVNSAWEGNFLERVAPSAFDRTIAEDRSGMKVLFDHGMDPQIGNKVLGPIRTLKADNVGPYYEVPLFDTTYNRDLLPGLKAGVYGASFRFRVTEEQWNDTPPVSAHNPKGIPERTIMATRTMEFGPVTFPASPSATAGVRSLTDEFYENLRSRAPKQYADAVRAAGMPAMPAYDNGDGPEADDGDDTPAGLAAGISAVLDAAMAACAAGDMTQCSALMTAAAATCDALTQMVTMPADMGQMNAAGDDGGEHRDLTGQPDTRSAGGGANDPPAGGPVPATPSPEDLGAVRHRLLRVKGIL